MSIDNVNLMGEHDEEKVDEGAIGGSVFDSITWQTPNRLFNKKIDETFDQNLKIPKRVKTRSYEKSSPADTNPGATMYVSANNEEIIISLCSLLNQFSSPQVRGDYLHGKFNEVLRPEFLPQIDEMRWLLLPGWERHNLLTKDKRTQLASSHLKKLLGRSPEVLESSLDGPQWSYSDWMKYLETLAMDEYWNKMASVARCTHIVQDLQPKKIDTKTIEQRKPFGLDFISTSERKMDKRNRRKIKVEEIILSSGDSTDLECTIDLNDDSSCSDETTSLIGKHRKRYHERSVVTPLPFEMNGKLHLREFFAVYEDYFNNKHVGSSFDKTQVLSQFLSGDLLKIYNILGGRRIRYSKMKNKLLEFYRKQRVGGKTYWRKELKNTLPENGEGLDIYGFRLSEVAKLAYPKDPSECATQLRNSFLEAIHPSIVSKILDAERTQKALSAGKRKHFSFTTMIQMAKDLQETIAKPKNVLWSSDLSKPEKNLLASKSEQFSGTAGIIERNTGCPNCARSAAKPNEISGNINPASVNQTQERKTMICSYCKRTGHDRSRCWRANNSCLICGDNNHKMIECDRYDPNRRPKSNSNSDNLNSGVSLPGRK